MPSSIFLQRGKGGTNVSRFPTFAADTIHMHKNRAPYSFFGAIPWYSAYFVTEGRRKPFASFGRRTSIST
jgi:hypothetical protein